MSASGAGGPRVRRLFARAANADSISDVVFKGIAAVAFAIGSALASGVLTMADLFIIPLSQLATGLGDIVNSLTGGSATIIDFGALATALALGPGGQFDAGPLTFALAVGAILMALYLVNRYIGLPGTGNILPLLPDVPTPLLEDAEEDEGE
jgi:hypothetical protein